MSYDIPMGYTTPLEEDKWPTLAELRARALPRPDSSFIKIEPREPSPTAEADMASCRKELDEYFKMFAEQVKKNDVTVCLRCGATLTGLFGNFTWGMAYGEGNCMVCRWPARAIHRIKFAIQGELTLRHHVLQYHPDELVEKAQTTET